MPVEVTVKTLDSNQYQFQIPDEFTVKEFKEHIANEVNVPWDKQRIIFGGKVLQDDRKLADCHVDKKTVHLVQKLPTLGTSSDSGASTSAPREGAPSRQQHQHIGTIHIPLNRTPGTLIVEAMIPPEPGDQIEQIIRQVINTMGSMNPMGVGTRLIDQTSPAGWSQQSTQGINNRLLTIRALFRVAFNSLNILEGRPTEVYQSRELSVPRLPGESQEAAAARQPQTNATNTTPRQPNRPFSYLTIQDIRPTREILSRVYQEFDCLQERLAPFMTRYRELLARPSVTADNLNEQGTRQLTSRLAITIHAISHIQHHLSDIEIDPRRPDQITTRQPSAIPMAIHGSLNVHSVALSNVPTRDSQNQQSQPAQQQQQQTQPGSRITVGQAASQAAGQASGARGQASAQGSSQAAQGAQVSTGTQTCTCGNSPSAGSEAAGEGTSQPQAAAPLSQLSQLQQQAQQHVQSVLNHFDIAARLSTSAFRGATRNSAPSSEAPSREDTTASNTTTNTTDTPTVAGSTMNSGPQPSPATINLTSRILTQGREQFDPYLACNSVWTHADRLGSRRSTSQRSSSAPAPMRRAAESGSSAAAGANRRAPTASASTTDEIDFTFRTPSNFEADLRDAFPTVRSSESIRSMPFGDLLIWNSRGDGESDFFDGLVRLLLSEVHSIDFLQIILQRRLELLNSLREPLQNYLRQHLLNGMPQTPALIEARVNEVTSEWSSQLPFGISEANILPGIDISATLVSFIRTRLVALFEFILNSTAEDAEFGLNLFMHCRDAVGYACVLLALCCDDAIESVDRILDSRIRSWNGIYTGPFPGEIMRHIRREASPVSPVNENALRRFIVRTQQTNSTSSVHMEVDPQDETNDSTSAISSNGIVTESRGVSRTGPPVSHEVALAALQAPASPENSPQSGVWRGVVPPGWAPIIARDMQTQPIQQRPLSDAYIEGMPTKRRRLMKPTNPSKLSNVHASVQEAIQRAGVRPRTSLEALGADLERNKVKLQDSLQKTIRDRLARRLTDDKDFEREKFPYAKRMAE